MSHMFKDCQSLTTLDVSKLDTSKVIDMSYMFENCSKLTTIGSVDTASGWQHTPTNYTSMFENCPAVPKPKWQHDFVEIAGIKWATMNVGANKVTDTGLYFQWGDTQGYTVDQITRKEKIFSSTNYNKELSIKYPLDSNTILALEDDPVHIAWGGGGLENANKRRMGKITGCYI